MRKLLGVNLEGWRSNAAARTWTDPRVAALLAGLHLGYARWFGGTTANYVNWLTGAFSASGNARQGIVRGQPAPALPAASWLAVCAAAGCAPLVQLNLCTEPSGRFVVDEPGADRQLADQLNLLALVMAGQPPTAELLVELGNELYLHGDPAAAHYAQNPDFYVAVADRFTSAIKAKYPGARVGACSLLDIYRSINPTWRQVVEAGLAGQVDAFTYHHYLPIPAAPTATNADALVASALADFDHAYGPTLATIPAGHTAWLTEWNYSQDSPLAAQMAASPTHGLVMAALAVRHLAEPVVELTGPHAAVGSAGGVYPAIAEDPAGVPALSTYGQALAGIGWLLNPSGPPPLTFG